MKRISVLVAVCVVALHSTLWAQERDTVFLHGLASDPGVWGPTADRLSGRLSIRTFRPTLNWRLGYESQSAQLEGQVGTSVASDVAAVGHSNGGIVARQWAKNRDVGSIVTLGSPNQGAPFVDHIFDWFGFADDILRRISNVYNVFFQAVNPDTWWWVPGEWRPLFESAADFWNVSSTGILALGFDIKAPVLSQMRVWSPYMGNLNSPSNLNHEAAEVAHRAAIISGAANFYYGGPFRILRPDNYGDWHNALIVTGITVDALAFMIRAFADPWDFGAFELADHLSTVAEWALQFEEVWCRSVSDPSPIYVGRCHEHDGIVPAWSQAYDYPRVQYFLMPNGPVHTREVAESDEALYLALSTVAQIPPRVQSPSPLLPPSNTIGGMPASPPAGTRTGRFKVSGTDCVWDPNDSGPDQCVPPAAKGAFKLDGRGACYWDANSTPPDQCSPPAPPTGRYKLDYSGACRWDANDGGPNQCVP